nr:MAG TPA: hypothetical protein [Caudoviricetes sp.]
MFLYFLFVYILYPNTMYTYIRSIYKYRAI